LIELNDDFIPILKNKYPRAKILNTDFLKSNIDNHYDIYLCNPPFNTKDEKLIYVSFFCKILNMMSDYSIFYFICPKMFYKNQDRIKIEIELTSNYDILNYIKETNEMPAKYYYDKYKLIELHSNEFRFSKAMIKRMIRNKIIDPIKFLGEFANYSTPLYIEFNRQLNHREQTIKLLSKDLLQNPNFKNLLLAGFSNRSTLIKNNEIFKNFMKENNINILEIGDKNGIVVFRFHRPEDYGDSKINQKIIKE
jgi:hypothetical protein